jgi:hypothetical protein
MGVLAGVVRIRHRPDAGGAPLSGTVTPRAAVVDLLPRATEAPANHRDLEAKILRVERALTERPSSAPRGY